VLQLVCAPTAQMRVRPQLLSLSLDLLIRGARLLLKYAAISPMQVTSMIRQAAVLI
jgi:hypothetical protein